MQHDISIMIRSDERLLQWRAMLQVKMEGSIVAARIRNRNAIKYIEVEQRVTVSVGCLSRLQRKAASRILSMKNGVPKGDSGVYDGSIRLLLGLII